MFDKKMCELEGADRCRYRNQMVTWQYGLIKYPVYSLKCKYAGKWFGSAALLLNVCYLPV